MLFAAAGAAMTAAHAALIWASSGLTHATATTFAAVLPLVLGLGLPAAFGLALAPRLERVAVDRASLGVLIVAGLAMRMLWLGRPAPLEDDFYRYLWDGAVVARGLNPYAVAPETIIGHPDAVAAYQGIAAAGQGIVSKINFPDMRTIYPSVAQLAFALAHLIAPFELDGLRIVFLLAECTTLWLLVTLLRELGRSPLWAALYWWNPLPVFMLVGIAHVDALVPPFVLGALLLANRSKILAALALLGLGAGVKVWPVVLAPILLARLLAVPRQLVVALGVLGAVLALGVGPLLLSALKPDSGLAAYASGWSMQNGFFMWAVWALEQLTGDDEIAERILRGMISLTTAGISLAVAVRGDATLRSTVVRCLIVAASVFYLSPAQFPWYGVWFLPLAALVPSWPLLLASATLPLYYLFYPLWETDRGDMFFYGVAFLHAVPVLGWLLLDAIRQHRENWLVARLRGFGRS